ncbi:hypothetical protein T07_9254 [Trichinella nelsoni]|uniref:Uncharacterized protein n=1 Tax=Trichinella nelsoni TaxID=6336 RepID=A0A0V0RD17_9BILA|nr:hypothetical protein T07_9254 [Trichinella nelsoni]
MSRTPQNSAVFKFKQNWNLNHTFFCHGSPEIAFRHFTAVKLRSALHEVIERVTDWQLSYILR